MADTAVFIDGGYLDKVLYYDHKRARIDFTQLAKEMAAPDDLLRSYYYHCMPYRSSRPTAEEKSRYSSMNRLINKLKFLPRFEVRLGRLVYRGTRDDGKPIFLQKRVDCMIGVDMALLAGKGRISNVALFSGDSDFIPAVEAVKNEGVLVKLWHGSFSKDTTPSRELVGVCDEHFELTADLVDRIKR